ncbi:MAG: peptidoglycan-binding protein [Roseitalea porphyridii]|uniref:peptidoglycan-binding protein n=1 Tax=Roseitalea porphyridii TaxID=1852022 RepID=UPI0032D8F9D7
MRERFDTANTLERLQEALTTLERRVEGSARQPRHGRQGAQGDLAAIRARQNRIDEDRGGRRRAPQERSRAEQLQREIGRLREDVGRQIKSSTGGFDALRDEIRSMRGAGDGRRDQARTTRTGAADLAGLRGDIEQLKSEVAALAREDTVRELTDRWSVIEREIADLPHSLASREDMTGLSGRLDEMHRAIGDLPRSSQLDTLDSHLHTLASAVEQVARHSTQASPAALDEIDARLDEISRAIASIPTARPAAAGEDTLERVEARITALANQVDQYAHALSATDYDAHFEELAARIDGLRLSVAPGTVSGEAMDALNARIDQIAEALDTLSRADTLSGDQSHFVTAELEDRLDAIDAQLRQTTALTERSVEDVMRSVDDRMAEIARRIDRSEQDRADVPSIAQLEHRLDEITAMLSSGAGAQTPVDMSSLEAQIAELSASLSPDRTMPFDEQTIWSAARTAAEEVAARVGTGADSLPDTLGHLTDDLRALETLARDTDSRNAKTFEAIHDTLLQVVDHLASLEQKVNGEPGTRAAPMPAADETMPAMAQPASPAPPARDEPLQIDEAPPLAADFDDRPMAEPNLRGDLSPAEAAAEAALFALSEDGRTRAAPEGGEREPRSFLKSMTDRLPLGRGRSAGDDAGADRADIDDDGPSVIDDQPIEPVGDQMALADIMARVRAERSAGGSPAEGSRPAQTPGAEAGKADFIAAARRAAQAAAADASISAKGGKNDKSGVAGSIGGLVSQRRKPILMAAGAILLALMAVPLVRGMMAPEPRNVAVETTPPAAVAQSEPQTESEIATAEPAEATPQEPVRDVTTEAGAVTAESRNAGEAATQAPAPVETAQAETTGTDAASDDLAEVQTIGFDDIPEQIGPIALRQAAIGGDAKALHVIGDRIARGAESDPDALAEAFDWYERAAELGYAPAQYRLGNFHEKGFGTERDIAAAKTWYQLAAEQGNASAMHNLAVLFASGADGAPDFDSAARWFLRAAELGVRDSQFNLGILSAKGQGMPQDLGESYKWFALAAQSGDEDAASKRDDIANVLRPDQLEQARGATALWKPKPVDQEVNVVSVPEAWQTDGQRTAAAEPLSGEDMKRAIANIQAILNDQGYDAGPVDGIMGGKTREAIIAFQRDNGLEASGNVDQALVEKLLTLANGEG